MSKPTILDCGLTFWIFTSGIIFYLICESGDETGAAMRVLTVTMKDSWKDSWKLKVKFFNYFLHILIIKIVDQKPFFHCIFMSLSNETHFHFNIFTSILCRTYFCDECVQQIIATSKKLVALIIMTYKIITYWCHRQTKLMPGGSYLFDS